MAKNTFLNLDLKSFTNFKNQLPKEASEALRKFQSQLSNYEVKALELVKGLEEKQFKVRRDLEKVSRQRLETFASELKKTRTTVEKRVLELVSEKGKDLQTRVNDIVIYLSGLAGKEVLKPAKKSSTKARKVPKKASARKAKSKRVARSNQNNRSTSARGTESLSPA